MTFPRISRVSSIFSSRSVVRLDFAAQLYVCFFANFLFIPFSLSLSLATYDGENMHARFLNMRVKKWWPVFRQVHDDNGNFVKNEEKFVFSTQVPQYQWKVKGNTDLTSTAFRGGKHMKKSEVLISSLIFVCLHVCCGFEIKNKAELS